MKLILLAIFLFSSYQQSLGQGSLKFSIFPGYHIINTDKLSAPDQTYTTDHVFGGMLSSDIIIRNVPIEISIGYSKGKSRFPTAISETVSLRYQHFPFEALYIHSLNDLINLYTGINISAQNRILEFSDSETKDQLLSYGLGFTGKLQTNFMKIRNTNTSIFASMTIRWTEYFFHDRSGSELNQFTYRHVSLTPQFGFRWIFNEHNSN